MSVERGEVQKAKTHWRGKRDVGGSPSDKNTKDFNSERPFILRGFKYTVVFKLLHATR